MVTQRATDPKQHVPTFEGELAPVLRESPKLATIYQTAELNQYVDSYVAVCGILPYLDRLSDFPAFSKTCRNWNSLAKVARAISPACARDIRLAVEFGLHTPKRREAKASKKQKGLFRATDSQSDEGSSYDGEYQLLHRGVGSAMTIYCHNVLSDRPTEFISLKEKNNFSYAPIGGSCWGSSVRTSFSKLRFNPWSLTVKTDDYTFARSRGGPLHQSYWNGEREITLNHVPYATARDSNGHSWGFGTNNERTLIDDLETRGEYPFLPRESGQAMIDLRGTGFGVENADKNDEESAFCAMGCSPYGRIAVKASPPLNFDQRIHLAGGGYAGRLAPRNDRTRDETASVYDFDDEGNNGGWVLPLKIVKEVEEIVEDEKWMVTAAVQVM